MPKNMFLVDLDSLSNGDGKAVYGGKLEAFSFFETGCEEWFAHFSEQVIAALGKEYLPVYRMADGEMRFLFGYKINWKNKPIRSLVKYLKYEVFRSSWKTSWGETYDAGKQKELRSMLKDCIARIGSMGRIALYWNKNGLNAFTEYNNSIETLFKKAHIQLDKDNYIPFHFVQALIARHAQALFQGRNILVVSGMAQTEFSDLQLELSAFKPSGVEFFQCSATASLAADYDHYKPAAPPDIVLVAAGIGAAKVVAQLSHLKCPVIDIGSYIHVLSGKNAKAHAGFFRKPSHKQHA
ncbi:MAG: hypothetical protein EOO01_08260 [Chitinophagaceae bacterium]|nr:MAG: hypothetical protein EOO01_08260 [Chitinophagaceae bacterium]